MIKKSVSHPQHNFGPPKRKVYPFESIAPEDLTIYVRGYAKGIHKFEANAVSHDELFSDISFLDSLRLKLDEIEYCLVGTKRLIQRAIDSEDYGDLAERLLEEAQGLESVLDGSPTLGVRQVVDDLYSQTYSDIDTLIDRLWDRLRTDGYDLYHYLIGAEF